KAVNPGSNVGFGRNNSLMADWTHLFSSTFILDARFGWTQTLSSSLPVDLNSNTSAEIGIPGLNDACPDCGGLAGFRVGGPVGNFDIGNSDHSRTIDNYGSYNYQAIATWNRGSHNFKFGADIDITWRDRLDTGSQGNFGCQDSSLCDVNGFSQNLTGTPDVPGSGLGVASLMLGLSSQFQRVVYANRLPEARQNLLAFFAQDQWQATRKLTLTLGLRWDYIGYPTSPTPGGIANFNFSNAYTIISNFGDTSATANVNNNYHDFGPRIGIAYKLTPNTVIRTGFARTFSLGYYGANFGAITNDWPNATRQRIVQSVDPYTPIGVTLMSGPTRFISGFEILQAAGNPGQYPTPLDSAGFGTDSDNPTHSIDQWNFSIQHAFKDFSFSAAYVGNAGRHIFYRTDWNAAVPGPGPLVSRRRYGALGYNVVEYNQSNHGSTGYNGLQLQAEKRYRGGFMLTTAVTWSKSYDFGIQTAMYPFDTNLDRAPQDLDRAFTVSVGHVWDLPFGPNRRFLNQPGPARFLFGGWQFSGISRWMSGAPFTPTLGNNASLNSDCCTLRPNRNAKGTVSNPNRSRWFDPTAFSVPAQYTFGNSGRNILRGPAFSSFDWALTKSFHFTERKQLELSWQVFNALNSTNLSNPVGTVDSATAGRILGIAAPMRRQQIGLHFFF
ncbi:MAG TPA: TonB-dependent receptor, partial [Bryobacteraceae bacterium]|nr:TonB-dependent receptor [Bryobacteraceae bacterium]